MLDISQGAWKRSQIKELHYKGSNVVFIKCRNGSYVEPRSFINIYLCVNMCVCHYNCICVAILVGVNMLVYENTCLYLYAHLCANMLISVSIFFLIYVPICLCVNMLVFVSVCVSLFQYFCLIQEKIVLSYVNNIFVFISHEKRNKIMLRNLAQRFW